MYQIAQANIKAPVLGNQLIVDFYDCDCAYFDDLDWIENVMIEAAHYARASIVDVVFHKFNPIGISGVVVIAESHLAIHTWPEHRYAAIDVFTCGDTLDSEAAVAYLATQFRCRKRSVTKVGRGESGELAGGFPGDKASISTHERLVAVETIASERTSSED
ncbi:MAG: adenosylmethionine decarboxylase [Gammaproteobacteria bacterium]|nr:adenosylmethionine decarboxylase [Gammaproteobacteria bacterium]